MAKRLGFENVDDFFDKKGYKRGVYQNRRKTSNNQIILTDRDLIEYNIIGPENENYSEIVDEFGISVLGVENNRATYEYLIGDCQDSMKKYKNSQEEYI